MDWNYLFASFEGRIGRQQFWIGAACLAIVGIVLSLILGTILGVGFMSRMDSFGAGPEELMRINSASGWVGLIVLAIVAYPSLAIMLKRRHDRGSAGRGAKAYLAVSAGLLLLQALGIGYGIQDFNGISMVMPNPILGIFGVVVGLYGLYLLVVMGFLKGDEGSNSYGADPLA